MLIGCWLVLFSIKSQAWIANLIPGTRVFVPDGDGLVLSGRPPFFTPGARCAESNAIASPPTLASRAVSGNRTLPSSKLAFDAHSTQSLEARLVLRFCGIDCPEHGQRDMSRAREVVRRELSLQTWTLHRVGLDVHARTLVVLSNARGQSLAALLVREGYCVIYPQFVARCPVWEQVALREAHEQAMLRGSEQSQRASLSSTSGLLLPARGPSIAPQLSPEAFALKPLASQPPRNAPPQHSLLAPNARGIRPRPAPTRASLASRAPTRASLARPAPSTATPTATRLAHSTLRFGTRFVERAGISRALREPMGGTGTAPRIPNDPTQELLPWEYRRRIEHLRGKGFFESMFH